MLAAKHSLVFNAVRPDDLPENNQIGAHSNASPLKEENDFGQTAAPPAPQLLPAVSLGIETKAPSYWTKVPAAASAVSVLPSRHYAENNGTEIVF